MERRPLIVLSLYQLLSSNRGGLFTVYFVLFLAKDKGSSIAEGLVILSAAYVGASLIGPLVGRWSDSLGRRRPFLLVGEVGSLPLFLAVPFLPGFLLAGAAFVAAEVVLAFGSPAVNAFVADVTGAKERGWGYGLLQATGAAGAIAGFLVAGYLVDRFGYVVLFYMVAAVMVGTISIVLFFVPDTRTAPSASRRPWRELKGVGIFSTTVSIRALGAGAVVTFYGVYAATLGASAFEISLIAIAGLVVTALLSVPLGRVVDRIGEVQGMVWGTTISIVAMVLYLLATRWEELVPARATYQVGFALMNPAMLSWVARIAPEARRAEYLGFFALINSTLWSLGPFVGGIAYQLAGPFGLFLFAIVATVISLVAIELIYVIRERRCRSDPDVPRKESGPSSAERPSGAAAHDPLRSSGG
ncbi:MAG: MFS transporter [Euryarchaeota archaeon]|nr:MFS transporter [Euryarchaeota archaeon]MDE1836759.1 MFS transporter [Euryarchaeota archaeon]MDE1879777.1 MFS transporter [Euryarchaeota archaeon]MDE2044743.1 MFS transporter [Thermoplasmata archaeon]